MRRCYKCSRPTARGDRARLAQLLPDVRGHVLEPWGAYWELRARLDQATPQDVSAFLQRYAGTYQEDRLRNDWLLLVGQRRDWAQFSELHALYRMNDDREVRCYALLVDQIKGSAAPARPTRYCATGMGCARRTTAARTPRPSSSPTSASLRWTCGARPGWRPRPIVRAPRAMRSGSSLPRRCRCCATCSTRPPSSSRAVPRHRAACGRNWWCCPSSRWRCRTPAPRPACWIPNGVRSSARKSATGCGA